MDQNPVALTVPDSIMYRLEHGATLILGTLKNGDLYVGECRELFGGGCHLSSPAYWLVRIHVVNQAILFLLQSSVDN